jgi:UDP-glucose 4-epimerase
MKVLILGGNGFIGSHLIDKFLEEGHYVRVFDKNEEYYRGILPNVDYRLGEFGNRGMLSEALEGIDVVIHLISTTLPKTSNDDPVFDVKTNVIETLFLLEQCCEKKIKKVIYTSSGGTVYGFPQNLPVHEDHIKEPICSYGISKLTIERYLALYKQLHDLDFVIIRPSNPFGIRQNPFGIQGAIPVFLGKIAKNEPIQIWGNGEVVRDYLYVEDLADAIFNSSIKKTVSNIFNIGSGRGYSLNQLLVVMKEVTSLDFEVIYNEARSFDVLEIYLDITRATTELGWKPSISLEYGIKQTWDFINKTNVK